MVKKSQQPLGHLNFVSLNDSEPLTSINHIELNIQPQPQNNQYQNSPQKYITFDGRKFRKKGDRFNSKKIERVTDFICTVRAYSTMITYNPTKNTYKKSKN